MNEYNNEHDKWGSGGCLHSRRQPHRGDSGKIPVTKSLSRRFSNWPFTLLERSQDRKVESGGFMGALQNVQYSGSRDSDWGFLGATGLSHGPDWKFRLLLWGSSFLVIFTVLNLFGISKTPFGVNLRRRY